MRIRADSKGARVRRIRLQAMDSTYFERVKMYRSLGAVALLILAIAVPAQDAAAQDPLGGAILGGAAGAILGGALGGGARSCSWCGCRRGYRRCHCFTRATASRGLPLLPARLLRGAWRRSVGRRRARVLRDGG